MTYNATKASHDTTYDFQPRAQSVQPVRIAFLTTEGTASASEININSMRPYVETAIVGDNTYGKPVGQEAFDLAGCDDRLRLISFKVVNSQGHGDYYNGLASSMSFACAAPDTLDKPLGDATEGMTSAALDWLRTGACGQVIAASSPGAAKPGGAAIHHFPLSRHPSAAEFWMPGHQLAGRHQTGSVTLRSSIGRPMPSTICQSSVVAMPSESVRGPSGVRPPSTIAPE